MRKEDRIRQQGDQTSAKPPDKPQPRPNEHVKGSESKEQPDHTQRQSGVLPIPD